MPPLVSVIVPVYNQSRALAVCLAALERQTYRRTIPDGVEVIVVDNGSAMSIFDLVMGFPSTYWTYEGRPGSYTARNAGVKIARGEVLAFIDADCVPEPDWIERGLAAVQALPGPGFVGGHVDIAYRDVKHLTGAELFERVYGLQQEHYVITMGFAVTANLWTTNTTMREAGPFDERLFSGGDVEWGQRVLHRGFEGVYADDVRVTHQARHLGPLLRRSVRVAGGIQQLMDRRGQGVRGLFGLAWRELIELQSIRRMPADVRSLRLAVVTWLVRAVQTLECYRVHFGGTPRRA